MAINTSLDVKLSLYTFESRRNWFLDILQSTREVYKLLIATLLNDVGKDPQLEKEITEKYSAGGPHPNHDHISYIAAKNDRLELMKESPEATVRFISTMREKFFS